MNEDINDYVPSILNPRCVKKHDLSLTQNSIVSRCSLSLKKSHIASQRNVLSKVNRSNKENSRNISNILSESQVKNVTKNVTQTRDLSGNDSLGFSAIEDFQTNKESSLSFGDFEVNENLKVKKIVEKINSHLPKSQLITKNVTPTKDLSGKDSIGLSAIDDFETSKESSLSFGDFEVNENLEVVKVVKKINSEENINQESFITVSSATELDKAEIKSEATLFYKGNNKPLINISFGINNCDSVNVTAKNGAIKQFNITHKDTSTNVDCEVLETSQISTETEVDENMNETSSSPRKRSAVAVSLEIKKQKLSNTDRAENSKVLILNTNAIEKISHVIVQPPNYKFVKRNSYRNFKRCNKSVENGGVTGLKQIPIDRFFRQTHANVDSKIGSDKWEDAEEMSRNSGVTNAVKCERAVRSAKAFRKETTELPKSAKLLLKRDDCSPKRSDVKTNSNAPSPRVASAHSPRKNIESIHFSIPTSRSNKSSFSPRNIPHHKIVAGTHFAVDAFSYGEIPNVKHYFLTHFHSDHYTGLKKSFNKLLFCSKITADLCISRLGVNAKCIRVINIDETLRIDSVEVTAVDANHCPGALMLVFTLPNGKTLLHTGDFRACPTMESYPVFWNRDIHTIYLDTTYCNPRYDFPTQDQSLEMALYILRQKKMALEKAGKKFTSVLIICGTYTIGKEKFFLGMSRRVGCSVWACPEKERVLQTVEGKTTTRDSPDACQLHVVPMRDLTHEKLRSYLDSLRGAFSEVVAFKPSGWENGKNSSVEKDGVTIHGIPYSEHSSFSELIRFVKFLKPKQVVPTVDISGGVKAVQKYFPCPLVYKDEIQCQSKLTDYFSIQSRQQATAVT